jgi:adenosine deaminase CECR1
MVGKENMGLYGWKQLIMWSLEHSCLSDQERADMLREWNKLWENFLADVIRWDEGRTKEWGDTMEEKSKM